MNTVPLKLDPAPGLLADAIARRDPALASLPELAATHPSTPAPFALNPLSLQPLSPGQVLVIHSAKPLNPVEKERLTRQLKIVLRGHNNPFIFLDGDFKVGVGNPQPVKP